MNNYDSNVVLIDNCISEKDQNLLENYVSSSKFPWGFYDGTILKSDLQYTNSCIIEKGINPPQFSHFINVSNNSNLIFFQSIFNFIASHYNRNIHILKVKFNLLTKREDSMYHYPHADIDNFDEEIKTAIYYVIDSDGDTYLFDQFAPKTNDEVTIYKTVAPKKGSILLFDSRRFHASSSPIINEKRIVLNVVFRIPKE
jgi:hypothetical protein